MPCKVVGHPQGHVAVTGGHCQHVVSTVQSSDVTPVVLQRCDVGVARGGAMYCHGTVLRCCRDHTEVVVDTRQ